MAIKTATKPKKKKQDKGLIGWLGKRYGKKHGASWAARGLRGGYRWFRKEAEGWSERKTARKEHRSPKLTTRRSRFAQRMSDRADAVKGITACTNCGARLVGREAAGHSCVTTAVVAATPKAKASKKKAAPAATAATGAPNAAVTTPPAGHFAKAKAQLKRIDRRDAMRHDPDAKKTHRAQRKADMTRPARVADTVARRATLAAGFAGRCTECNSVVRNSEAATHKCWSAARTAGFAPPPNDPYGKPLGTSNATQAPAATGNAPAGTTNGEGSPVTAPATTNGSGGSGGASTAAAASVVAAWSAWSQERPRTRDEMTAKMNSTRQAVGQTSHHVRQFAAWMAAPRANGGGGFDPACVQPLIQAADAMAEVAGQFTNVLQAIAMTYGAVIAHYESGVADPGSTFFSNGRVPSN